VKEKELIERDKNSYIYVGDIVKATFYPGFRGRLGEVRSCLDNSCLVQFFTIEGKYWVDRKYLIKVKK